MTTKDLNQPLQQQIAETQYRTKFKSDKKSKSTINAVERIFKTETYRLLVGAMKEGVAVLSETGKIVYCNDSFARILKSCSDRIIGYELEAIVPADSAKELKQLTTNFVEQNKVLFLKDTDNDYTAVNASASNIIFDNCTVTFLVLSNISAYIDEGQIRETEKSFQDIFENTVFGIALMDAEMKLFRTNKTFTQITGYRKEELTTVSKFTYAVDVKTELFLIKQVLRGQQKKYSLEKRALCKDGSIKWIKVTSLPTLNQKGEFAYFVVTVEDVTERKLIENKLNRYRANLEQLVEERTRQLVSARRSAIIGQAAGLVGQQILLKYIFRDEHAGAS